MAVTATMVAQSSNTGLTVQTSTISVSNGTRLVACVGVYGQIVSAIDDSSTAWTLLKKDSSNVTGIYYRDFTSSGTVRLTVTQNSSGSLSCVVYSIAGSKPSGFAGATGSDGSGTLTGGNLNAPVFTSTAANSLCLISVVDFAKGTLTSSDSTFKINNLSDQSIATGYKQCANMGAETVNIHTDTTPADQYWSAVEILDTPINVAETLTGTEVGTRKLINGTVSVTETLTGSEVASRILSSVTLSVSETLTGVEAASKLDMGPYRFTTPSVPGLRGDTGVFRFIDIPIGVTVLRIGGFYRRVQNPTEAQRASATEMYLGGRSYIVSGVVAQRLRDAGYGSYLQGV